MRALSLFIFLIFASLLHTGDAFGLSFNNPLVDAADRGDKDQVLELLRRGYVPDSEGDFRVTPLMRAAFRGHADIVSTLIDVGAYVNAADLGGATALHLAAKNGHADVVEILLEADAVIDIPDKEKWTPLMRAIMAKQTGVAKILLDEGADITRVNEMDETVLVHAAMVGIPDIMKMISGNNKFSKLDDYQSELALSILQKKGYEASEEVLLSSIMSRNKVAKAIGVDYFPGAESRSVERTPLDYELSPTGKFIKKQPPREVEEIPLLQREYTQALSDDVAVTERGQDETTIDRGQSYSSSFAETLPWKKEAKKEGILKRMAKSVTDKVLFRDSSKQEQEEDTPILDEPSFELSQRPETPPQPLNIEKLQRKTTEEVVPTQTASLQVREAREEERSIAEKIERDRLYLTKLQEEIAKLDSKIDEFNSLKESVVVEAPKPFEIASADSSNTEEPKITKDIKPNANKPKETKEVAEEKVEGAPSVIAEEKPSVDVTSEVVDYLETEKPMAPADEVKEMVKVTKSPNAPTPLQRPFDPFNLPAKVSSLAPELQVVEPPVEKSIEEVVKSLKEELKEETKAEVRQAVKEAMKEIAQDEIVLAKAAPQPKPITEETLDKKGDQEQENTLSEPPAEIEAVTEVPVLSVTEQPTKVDEVSKALEVIRQANTSEILPWKTETIVLADASEPSEPLGDLKDSPSDTKEEPAVPEIQQLHKPTPVFKTQYESLKGTINNDKESDTLQPEKSVAKEVAPAPKEPEASKEQKVLAKEPSQQTVTPSPSPSIVVQPTPRPTTQPMVAEPQAIAAPPAPVQQAAPQPTPVVPTPSAAASYIPQPRYRESRVVEEAPVKAVQEGVAKKPSIFNEQESFEPVYDYKTPPEKEYTQPAPQARQVAPTPVSTSYNSSFFIQLGAFASEDQALFMWERMLQANADALSGLEPHVVRAFLTRNNVVVYRLRVGYFNQKSRAKNICNTLRDRGIECFVVETTADPELMIKETKEVMESLVKDENSYVARQLKESGWLSSGGERYAARPPAAEAPAPIDLEQEVALTKEAEPQPQRQAQQIELNDESIQAPISEEIPTQIEEEIEQMARQEVAEMIQNEGLTKQAEVNISEPVQASSANNYEPLAPFVQQTVGALGEEELPWQEPDGGQSNEVLPWKQAAAAPVAKPLPRVRREASVYEQPKLQPQSSRNPYNIARPPATTSQVPIPVVPDSSARKIYAGNTSNAPLDLQQESNEAEEFESRAELEAQRGKIREEIRNKTREQFFKAQGKEAPELEVERNYDDFYRDIEKRLDKKGAVSEAVLVPDDTYFSGARKQKVEATTPEPKGVWIKISGFSSEQQARDYWLRMFQYDESMSHLNMVVARERKRGYEDISIQVTNFRQNEAPDVCYIVNPSGYQCSIKGSETLASNDNKNYTPSWQGEAIETEMPQYWVALGTFSDVSEAEYYWMFLLEDHEDILHDVKYDVTSAAEHKEFSLEAVQLKAGPFDTSGRASQLCDILSYRNVACIVAQ